MKKQIRAHEERNIKTADKAEEHNEPIPTYLLDRSNPKSAKALSSAVKNKRAEKAAKFSVPLPKVKGVSEEEMFSAVKTYGTHFSIGYEKDSDNLILEAKRRRRRVGSEWSMCQPLLVRTLHDVLSNTNDLYGQWV